MPNNQAIEYDTTHEGLFLSQGPAMEDLDLKVDQKILKLKGT